LKINGLQQEPFQIQQFPLWKKGVQMVKRIKRIEGLKRIFFDLGKKIRFNPSIRFTISTALESRR
jgi:hypothetical protein